VKTKVAESRVSTDRKDRALTPSKNATGWITQSGQTVSQNPEAARKTFQEAIQREVKKSSPQADGRLYEIGMAQARMGTTRRSKKNRFNDP